MTNASDELDELMRHDELCDEFSAAYRAGAAPRIEDVLRRVPEAERCFLFEELLRIEIEHQGEQASEFAQYWNRFPEYADILNAHLGNLAADTGPFEPPNWGPVAPPPDLEDE